MRLLDDNSNNSSPNGTTSIFPPNETTTTTTTLHSPQQDLSRTSSAASTLISSLISETKLLRGRRSNDSRPIIMQSKFFPTACLDGLGTGAASSPTGALPPLLEPTFASVLPHHAPEHHPHQHHNARAHHHHHHNAVEVTAGTDGAALSVISTLDGATSGQPIDTSSSTTNIAATATTTVNGENTAGAIGSHSSSGCAVVSRRGKRSSSPSTTTLASTPATKQQQPPGKTMLTSLTLLGVLYANCIGSGYGFEDTVGAAGPLITLVFCLFLPWLWLLPTGLAVSELATSVPSNSGVLMWVNVAYPPSVSFMSVLITALVTFVGNASYPNLAASYVSRIIPLSSFGEAIVKLLCIWLSAVLNMLGAEVVGNASVLMSIATLFPFLVFTAKVFLWDGIVGLIFLSSSSSTAAAAAASASVSSGLLHVSTASSSAAAGGISSSAAAVPTVVAFTGDFSPLWYVPPSIQWSVFLAVISWSFANIENAGSVVEEVHNPKKTMAKAMVPLMFLTYPAYFLPVTAAVLSFGPSQDFSKWTSGYWSEVALALCGPWLKYALFIGAIVTSFGFTLTTLCCTSRTLAGMGNMEVFPTTVSRFLRALHPTYHTPVHAIVLNAAVTTVMSLGLEFERIVAMCQAVYCLRLLLIYGAVIRLRVQHPTLRRPYALPFGTIGSILFLTPAFLFSLVVTLSCIWMDSLVFYGVVGFVLAGSALSVGYVTWRRPNGFQGQILHVSRSSSSSSSSHHQKLLTIARRSTEMEDMGSTPISFAEPLPNRQAIITNINRGPEQQAEVEYDDDFVLASGSTSSSSSSHGSRSSSCVGGGRYGDEEGGGGRLVAAVEGVDTMQKGSAAHPRRQEAVEDEGEELESELEGEGSRETMRLLRDADGTTAAGNGSAGSRAVPFGGVREDLRRRRQ